MRLGKQRGARVAEVDIARKLTEPIWHMLTTNQPFNPEAAGGAAFVLAARRLSLELRPRSGLQYRLVLHEQAIEK